MVTPIVISATFLQSDEKYNILLAFLQPVKVDILKFELRGGHYSAKGRIAKGTGWVDEF